MNNEHHNGHFFDGFLLGIIVGAAAVFLLGTKSGKNLLKILSEQGVDGIKDLMEDYNIDSEEEELEEEGPEIIEKIQEKKQDVQKKAEEKMEDAQETIKPAKKRFFKRLRR